MPAIAEHPKENLQNWEIVTFHKPITDRVDAPWSFSLRQSLCVGCGRVTAASVNRVQGE
ncbi:MAG: hypothetical protein R2857_03245 [Vampirovibrionales bacterium]